MTKSLLAGLGVVLLAGALGAQTHNNVTEPKASDQLTLVSPVRIGTEMMPAGEYRVTCDRTKIRFVRTDDGKKVLELPCQGPELKEKATSTIAVTDLDSAGVRYLKKLQLRGSTVEHVFP